MVVHTIVKLKIIGHLKLKTGFDIKNIKLDKPTVLRDIISFADVKDERLVILINEKGGKMDSIITDDDEVKIFPVVGGG
ncbi:MAG: MoaD/ThiS family protein [Candidatus Heimdallarchaeota archaeon]|nr:MoaD/ThiS family protein [Candidatus Heimdallarchaeota archaeon]